MSFTIRRATPADAERVVDITRRNFTETFGHLYPLEDLAYFLDNSYSLDAHRALLADDGYAIWLLERDGPRTLWIGVWSENLGAQRFYGRYGFEKVGEYLFPVGNTNDHEFILRRLKTAAAHG